MPTSNPQSAKRQKLSHTDTIINLLGPSRNRTSAILPRRRPKRPELDLPILQQNSFPSIPPSSRNIEADTTNNNSLLPSPKHDTLNEAVAPLPKLVDSPLTSENIEAALCTIESNTKKKSNSFDKLLQAFHDLYRWSRLPNRDHQSFFLNEFVWELSGISRVMKFLKAYNMGDVFLCQLLQTEQPFNE